MVGLITVQCFRGSGVWDLSEIILVLLLPCLMSKVCSLEITVM